jgi:glycosyltransferase involved in cell wall biosynthesis/hydroxymethylpyrimidine pyrophosphatase-like HAD family hydrolase
MRRFLIITEKYEPDINGRDGGYFLVETLTKLLAGQVDIIQFGTQPTTNNSKYYTYPITNSNRFTQRIENRGFVAGKVMELMDGYTDLIFVHVSLLFGLNHHSSQKPTIWLFPMFLSPSYNSSNELIPTQYIALETEALRVANRIICPGYLERNQIINHYRTSIEKIRVIPRGVKHHYFSTTGRQLENNETLMFCSVGSVKRQKNTLGLIRIFKTIHNNFPKSHLRVIGPIQDFHYMEEVRLEIQLLSLENCVEFTGYISKAELRLQLADMHIHLSASLCETFGRSIFETLSAGLPNIFRRANNAATDFLDIYPFACGYENESDIIEHLQFILAHYNTMSQMATDIGLIYNEAKVANLLAAELLSLESIIVSDFDGTLYHKEDAIKTQQCISIFNSYPKRVICTSRSLFDISNFVLQFDIQADYIISWGGAVISDINGVILALNPLSDPFVETQLFKDIAAVQFKNELIQYISTDEHLPAELPGYRVETYSGIHYISAWNQTKLRGVQQLLEIIQWKGKICCFGDSYYDLEFLRYYDGYLLSNSKVKNEILKTTDILIL